MEVQNEKIVGGAVHCKGFNTPMLPRRRLNSARTVMICIPSYQWGFSLPWAEKMSRTASAGVAKFTVRQRMRSRVESASNSASTGRVRIHLPTDGPGPGPGVRRAHGLRWCIRRGNIG